jgi:predicted dehydrogenase
MGVEPFFLTSKRLNVLNHPARTCSFMARQGDQRLTLRFGLIGCGEIGRLRAAALKRCATAQLVAVTDIDHRLSETVGARYCSLVEDDWHMMVRRDDIDAVIVSTPPSLHAEMSIEALNAGKHVLCEKPLARNPAECHAMVAAAKTNDRFLATGFNYRFYPSIEKARALLDSGLIGKLDHVRAYTGYSAAEHNHDWLHDSEIMGGGALRDNGIHLIDLTCYFLGEVVEVKGFASNSVWGFKGCEDNGFALLRNSAGKIATLQASWTEWRRYSFRIEIYGTRGCIRTSCFPMLTQVTWSKELAGKTNRRNYFFPMTHICEHVRSYRWVVVQSFQRELNAFCRSVLEEYTEVATGEDGLRAVEIANAVSHHKDNKGVQV